MKKASSLAGTLVAGIVMIGSVAILGRGPAASAAPAPAPATDPAAATTPHPVGPLGIARRHGRSAGSVRAASEPIYCSECTPPLAYKGGSVTGTPAKTGETTVTSIYWAASGGNASFPATYPPTIDGYVQNVAAASGATNNVYANNTQYFQNLGGQSSAISYLIHDGGHVDDTSPYPGGQ